MNKKVELFRPVIYILIATATAITALTAFFDRTLFYIAGPILLVGILLVFIKLKNVNKDIATFLTDMGKSIDVMQKDTLIGFPLPVIITDDKGEIMWHNTKAGALSAEEIVLYGCHITDIIGEVDYKTKMTDKGIGVKYAGRMYTVYAVKTTHHDTEMIAFYFTDDTELKKYTTEYFQSKPSVMLIMIDNYEELMQSSKEGERTLILSDVEYMIEQFAKENDGLLCKLDRNKYVAIFEERSIKSILENRFEILDKVRNLVVGDKMPATLSIGLSRDSDNLIAAEQMARQALDMSLGRGGDQAAIKTQNGYDFFGGVAKGIEKRTKVKTRIVATALSELIENSENVILMGHRFADLDCFGAAIGLLKVIKLTGKNAYIAIDRDKNLVGALYERMLQNGYEDCFYNPEQLMDKITKNTLLIIVDTHLQHFLESAELYRACKNVVVIDHHRKMVGHVENAVIFYHEPYASSTCEMVTELVQYFGEKRKITRPEAEALLSGIMLDTKNFIIRTGVRTFEAAAFLRKVGADTVEVRKLFSSTMDEYQKRSRLVASAEVYRGCAIASSANTDEIKIIAPQAADELLTISNVNASFVMYDYDGGVSFSARSMGAMNVQTVMEALGGGGHQTMAGAQIENISLEDARQLLLEAIDGFYDKKKVV